MNFVKMKLAEQTVIVNLDLVSKVEVRKDEVVIRMLSNDPEMKLAAADFHDPVEWERFRAYWLRIAGKYAVTERPGDFSRGTFEK